MSEEQQNEANKPAPQEPKKPNDVLNKAIKRREEGRPKYPVDAFRIVNGTGDNAPAGLVFDVYDRYGVLTAREAIEAKVVDEYASLAMKKMSLDGVVVKRVGKDPKAKFPATVLGEQPPQKINVREGDLKFVCRLRDGMPTGLYLDHRETRLLARSYAEGAEVLNLFCYTGAFSVHVAAGGAKRVTSVDVSKKALKAGRENMEVNELDPDQHRWFDDDAMKHVKSGDQQYDLVIADPPVFGQAGKKAFSLDRDMNDLLVGCLGKVAPGGKLIFSTHKIGLGFEDMMGHVAHAGAAAGRTYKIIGKHGLPSWDHPADPGLTDGDRGAYLTTLVLSLD